MIIRDLLNSCNLSHHPGHLESSGIMVSWGGEGWPNCAWRAQRLAANGERRERHPATTRPRIGPQVETLVGGVRSQNTDGGLYWTRLSAFYLWCAWHNLHLAFAINEYMPWTESEHKKGVIDNLLGPMCQCIVCRGKNWVVSDVGTWSRRSYAIDCEYSSSSAPAPSTYKHSTYLGPSSDTISHYD